MKNAQVWKLKGSPRPIIKIEYTIYDFYYKNAHGGVGEIEVDASALWNGTAAPKGAKLLGTVKVPNNDKKSARYAYEVWDH